MTPVSFWKPACSRALRATTPTSVIGPQPMASAASPAGAAARQAFHIGVGGDVVGLPRIADQCRHRREQDEIVERHVRAPAIEIVDAFDLRRQHALEAIVVEIGEKSVIENHRGVQDAGDRRHRGAAFRTAAERRAIRDVAGLGEHLDAAATKSPTAASPPASRAMPADHDEVRAPCSTNHLAVSSPNPPNAPVMRWVPGVDLKRLARRRRRRSRAARTHHDLADMTRMLHQVESLGDVAASNTLYGSGVQLPVLELLHHLAEDALADALRAAISWSTSTPK